VHHFGIDGGVFGVEAPLAEATDLLNERAVEFVSRKRRHPFALFFAHKAVHPDVQQRQDGTIDPSTMQGYVLPERHKDLYRGCTYPPRPNVLPLEKILREKPAWREVFELRERPGMRAFLDAIHVGDPEEVRERAAMMASVDEGVGMLLQALERSGKLDDTCIVFLGDNGFFFGEHGLGAERRFAYEEGIRTALFVRYPRLVKPGTVLERMVLALDIAPTMIELAGGRPGSQIQGRSFVPLLKRKARGWRRSFLVECYDGAAGPGDGRRTPDERRRAGVGPPVSQPRPGGRRHRAEGRDPRRDRGTAGAPASRRRSIGGDTARHQRHHALAKAEALEAR
jgi:N-acetylglucosamine-6-sulfatase